MELQVRCYLNIFNQTLAFPCHKKLNANAYDVAKDFNLEVPNCSPRAMHINEWKGKEKKEEGRLEGQLLTNGTMDRGNRMRTA